MSLRIQPGAASAATGGHDHGTGPQAGGHDHGAPAPPASANPTGQTLDLAAPFGDEFTPYPAALAPPATSTLHRVEIPVVETDLQVAPGVRQRMWTFGGTVPGPALRGRVGDVFEVTLVNQGSLGHGIDFHASALAPQGPMRILAPGERLVYRFQATKAGVWLYHCFVELTFPEPGHYPFLDHNLRHADNGAGGAFTVTG
jgi:nitrite reductase (NO-forming)